MTADRHDLDALIAEVTALKRRMRIQVRALAAVSALCVGAAVLFAAGPLHSQAQKITANEITLVDANGATRGVLSGDSGIGLVDSALAFYNAAGERRLLVDVADNEPTIYLLDAQGRTRLFLDVNAAGEPRLSLNDDKPQSRIQFKVDDGGIPGMLLFDEEGRRRYLLNLESGEASENFFEAGGVRRLHINGGSAPRIEMFDSDGKQRAEMAFDSTMPFFALSDANDKQRLKLGVDPLGASLTLYDAAGGISTRLSQR
jgi:hypothetical protein